ncbi:hypothetical protein HAX54_007405 [Datura stramonium]|uniref:Uncharacterized protein n=1 Tax=Datura stramonium TaxID=4076 RepID=A0ABS8TBP4_DATST|nr:hypothetical protein [Datura stramonium]
MSERSDNPPLGRHGPLESGSFFVSGWSEDPPRGHHSSTPPKLTSFSVSEQSNNPPLGRHGLLDSASFFVPGRPEDPPLGCHGLPRSALYSVPGRSDNPPPGRRHGPPKSVSFSVPERPPSALKIIHAGGVAEYYYMATPAARILEKYPSFILARPDVFRRPWDSVVHEDEILIPGQKYYVVPQCTLKKLRRRIKKNSGIIINNNTNNLSFISQSSQDSSKKAQQHTSIIKKKSSSDHKNKARNRRVRFLGIDCKQDYSSCSVSLEMISKENHEKILNDPQRICRARNGQRWRNNARIYVELKGVHNQSSSFHEALEVYVNFLW